MERRDFIKSGCQFCGMSIAALVLTQFSGCSPSAFPIYKTDAAADHKISIPLQLFDQSALQIVRPKNSYFDIAVQKRPDNTFLALQLLCTHQENQLTVTSKGFTCSMHGSQFDKEGNVRKGPAEKPLESFKTYIDQQNLIISI